MIENKEIESLIISIIREAIGKAKIFVSSYETYYNPYCGTNQTVKINISGEVNGTLTLDMKPIEKFNTLRRLFKQDKSKKLEEAEEQISKLEKELEEIRKIVTKTQKPEWWRMSK